MLCWAFEMHVKSCGWSNLSFGLALNSSGSVFLHCKLFAKMGDDRPFMCHAPGCGQRFTNEDHLAVHKHKHEMTLKFTPRTDSVIIADQTPTPTRFLKNCEEVGLFNDLANSFEQDDDDNKQAKNSLPADSSVALDMSLQTPSDVKVKEETPVAVDSSAPDSPDSISVTPEGRKEHLVKDIPPRSSAPTPTIVRPGSLPLHLGFDALQPTMPSPTSVITQAPPSNRTLGSPTSHYSMMMLPSGQAVPVLPGPVQMQSVINLARPMCMVPNIPGIPGPPLGSNSSGSNSPSGYSIHCDAKMRLKAALSQQSPSGHSVAMMAMGNSPMVPQRAEQSQLLVQHPDAPSPAQPQVSPAQPTGGRRRRTADDDPDERRQRFLERNRAAASRCRQKRKLWVNSLEKKAEELSTLNVSLSFGVYRASFLMTTGIGSITPTSFNEVSLLRNEVAHLKQLLLAHKDCPVTTLQKKSAYLAVDESMKDTSEPTGSPAPVIQHSSLAPSPSAGHNGLSSRAAAEAMAMSVLAGLGQQQNVESGASHIIMATHSQSSAR
ncbi:cyclic AMP-dependent transcription factor ATF-7a isoform X3 [Syngnathoides biaculeatus]|uniref:cyclic AMP-dependent transcription factor ATF-7a isoform X3 n=1 Tax=Syngnathoides biaculeatus TaxID=300417 RepID=UPI002ADD9345|nr:cyclic AMP-dependent transcription factor ATF-7a isoform X3 [Syngnathoides biaculeatus]